MSRELPSDINIMQMRGNRRNFFRFTKGIGMGLAGALLASETQASSSTDTQSVQTPTQETENEDNKDNNNSYVSEGAQFGGIAGLVTGIDISWNKNLPIGAAVGLGLGTGTIMGGTGGLIYASLKTEENKL